MKFYIFRIRERDDNFKFSGLEIRALDIKASADSPYLDLVITDKPKASGLNRMCVGDSQIALLLQFPDKPSKFQYRPLKLSLIG